MDAHDPVNGAKDSSPDKPEDPEDTLVEVYPLLTNESPAPDDPYAVFNRDSHAQSGAESRTDRQRAHANFSAGQVFSLTVSSIVKNPLLYLSLAIIASLPGILLNSTYGKQTFADALIDMFFAIIFMGAISYGVYQNLLGRQAGLLEAVSRGLSRYFSLVGVSLLYLVGLFLFVISFMIFRGILMVVPIFMLLYVACIVCVVTPACVVDGLGATDSFHRSAELTKGHRLSIFGMFLVYYICVAALSALLGAISPPDFSGKSIGETVAQPVFIAVQQVLIATLYYQLRVAREGVSVDKLVTVFD